MSQWRSERRKSVGVSGDGRGYKFRPFHSETSTVRWQGYDESSASPGTGRRSRNRNEGVSQGTKGGRPPQQERGSKSQGIKSTPSPTTPKRRGRVRSIHRAIPRSRAAEAERSSSDQPNSFLEFARNFRDRELELVRELWRMIDLDKDGRVTRAELSLVLAELGIEASKGEQEGLFEQLDPDQSGYVTFDDFVRGVEWLQRSARLTGLLSPTGVEERGNVPKQAAEKLRSEKQNELEWQRKSSNRIERSPRGVRKKNVMPPMQVGSPGVQMLNTLRELSPEQFLRLEGYVEGLQATGKIEVSRDNLATFMRQERIPFDRQTISLLWRELDPSGKRTVPATQFVEQLQWLRRGLHMVSSARVRNRAQISHQGKTTPKSKEQRGGGWKPARRSSQASGSSESSANNSPNVTRLHGKRASTRVSKNAIPLPGMGSSEMVRPLHTQGKDTSVVEEELAELQQHVRTLFDLALQHAAVQSESGHVHEAKGTADALLVHEGLLAYMGENLKLNIKALRKRCATFSTHSEVASSYDSSKLSSSTTSEKDDTRQQAAKWRSRAKKTQKALDQANREKKETQRHVQHLEAQLGRYREKEAMESSRLEDDRLGLVDSYAGEHRDLLPRNHHRRRGNVQSDDSSVVSNEKESCCVIS